MAPTRLSLLFFFLLAACAAPAGTPTPTLLPPADTPVVTGPEANTPPPPEMTTSQGSSGPTRAPDAALAVASLPTAVAAGDGIRPEQASLFRQPDPGIELTVEWRPPPLPVPLSIHPDDHYWLIRPLPSDRRNYELEWFPYGNDVLLPDLAPYRVHRGLDFPNHTGTPVLAASSGTVIHAGPLPSRIDGINYYGNTVIIHHDWQWRGQDVYTLYAHTLELFVKAGDYVEQGQLIAGVGRSGIVSGPHLHLEVRIGRNNYDDTRNPLLWIAPYEGWGNLAGRLVDIRGRFIHGGWVSARPLDVAAPTVSRYTYMIREVNPDDVWQENFVIPDLPAGRYEVTAIIAGKTYRKNVEVLPGRTNFVLFQTDFVYSPPTPTPTVVTGTVPISGTVPVTDSVAPGD